MLKWLVGILGGLIVIASVVALTSESEAHPLDAYDMSGKNVEETVAFLEATDFDRNTFAASIDGETLSVQNEESSAEYALPEDMFYASIAPYVDSTHPCGTHNLVTCQGEMVSETFDVTIKDASGTVIFDEEVETEKNGFFGIWLPRDVEGTIDITHGDLSTSGEISTFASSNTCYTDFQLS
ncbi:MAG: CueP family metal-binding protein [Bacillota bacterium]